MISLLPIIFTGLVLFAIIEGTHYSVFGGLIAENELDAYLSKHFDTLELNEFSRNNSLFWSSTLPKYIAQSQTFISKWYISEMGVIPRWSKWSKKLDQKRTELLSHS